MKIQTALLLSLALTFACRKPPEDDDGDGASALVDCDDTNADILPGAEELCNGIDDDCSGDIDEDATDAQTFNADFDGDGFGSASVTQASCTAPDGFVSDATDCDDAAADVNPDAKDDCLVDRDFNCDGSVGFADADADGFPACEDCNDKAAAVNPTAVELCNGDDDNCDGIDDNDAVGTHTYYADTDNDGFGDPATASDACEAPAGFVANDNDCNDDVTGTHPGATETCDDVDQNCNGVIDEEASNSKTFYLDADGDGHGGSVSQIACAAPASFVSTSTDCDDLDAKTHAGAAEACDGADNDCNNAIPANESDADVDGWFGCEGDCNDTKANVNPAAPEICDGADNNCNTQVDESAVGTVTWYVDGDGDGFGTGSAVTGCARPATGTSFSGGDCDDAKANVNPAATEICDGADNNCNSQVDESAVGTLTWYVDVDGDGYGTGSAVTGCVRPATGTSLTAGDCNDNVKSTHPNAIEFCDATDRDCDGNATNDAVDGKLYYTDADGDTYGNPNATQWACVRPANGVSDSTDCADNNSKAFPDSTATEIPGDGVDMNCDGLDVCTDLNCDGMPDLVLPSHHDGDYIVSSKNALSGPAGLALGGNALSQFGTLGHEVEDLNKDGYLDLVYASYNNGVTENTNSYVFWGSATGYADANRTALPTSGAHWTCVGDLNADGWKDVVFADHYDGDYVVDSYVYWSTNGVFSATNRTALAGQGATGCAIDDLNADGRPDVVLSNYYNGSYAINSYVYYNSATGFSTTNRADLPTVGSYRVSTADLNEDGRKDLVFWSHYDGDHFTDSYIYFNSPSGFSLGNRTTIANYGSYRGSIADLNGDGHLDILAPGYYNAAWTNMVPTYIYWGSGTTSFPTTNRTQLTSRGILSSEVNDVDMDGYPDIILLSHHDGDYQTTSMVFWGAPSGAFNDANHTDYFTYGGVEGADAVDLNHDGYKDLFLPGYHNNGWANMAYSRIYWGNPTGRPNPSAYSEIESRGAWSASVVGQ